MTDLVVSPIVKESIDKVQIVLNSVLPVVYPPAFYKQLGINSWLLRKYFDYNIAALGKYFGFVAATKDKIVGAIVADRDNSGKIHILALGVLVLYRERGVASQLLRECLSNNSEAYLHVQSDNETAIQFYKQRGFVITETVPDYYRRVSCTEAVKMIRERTQWIVQTLLLSRIVEERNERWRVKKIDWRSEGRVIQSHGTTLGNIDWWRPVKVWVVRVCWSSLSWSRLLLNTFLKKLTNQMWVFIISCSIDQSEASI